MTFEELVTELRDRNVRIYDEGRSFKLQAPYGVLTSQLLEEITLYTPNLLYLIRLGDVRVCPDRWTHRPYWHYSQSVHRFLCGACRQRMAA